MSLFSKIEVNENMIPFIENNEGVGIVKVDGYGKSSARIESYKLILESYDDKQPIIESIASINYLSYKEGNFFNEPKLEIGISHKKYILAGAYNNDEELEAFYNKLLELKNKEKEQNSSSHSNVLQSNPNSNVKQVITENIESDDESNNSVETTTSEKTDIIDLEKEVINKDSDSSNEILDEIVDEANTKETQKTSKTKNDSTVQKLTIDEDDNDFEVLAELSEEEAVETIKEVDNKTQKVAGKQVLEEEIIEDEEEFLEDEEDFEEIVLEDTTSKNTTLQEPIVEEAEEFDDEEEIFIEDDITDSKDKIKKSISNDISNKLKISNETIQESVQKDIEEETTNIERQVPEIEQDTQDKSTTREKFKPSKILKSLNKKFSSNDINDDLKPFIENNAGVGIVNIDGYGKSSARIESDKFILESYEDKQPIIESLSQLNNLNYKKGNIFNEPKLTVDISQNKYILAGEDNNDEELESFYKKLLEIKNDTKQSDNFSNNTNLANDKSNVKEDSDNKINDISENNDIKVSQDKDQNDEIIIEETTNVERQIPKSSDKSTLNQKIDDKTQTLTDKKQVQNDSSIPDVNKLSEQVSSNINDTSNDIVQDSQQFNQYIPTTKQVDPVDQIKRYYELKEQGIITEEEFEQKKKQLLDL